MQNGKLLQYDYKCTAHGAVPNRKFTTVKLRWMNCFVYLRFRRRPGRIANERNRIRKTSFAEPFYHFVHIHLFLFENLSHKCLIFVDGPCQEFCFCQLFFKYFRHPPSSVKLFQTFVPFIRIFSFYSVSCDGIIRLYFKSNSLKTMTSSFSMRSSLKIAPPPEM